MYSNLRTMLGLPESTSQAALCKACNECYFMYCEIAANSSDARIKELAMEKTELLLELIEQEGIEFATSKIYDTKVGYRSITAVESELSAITTKGAAVNKYTRLDSMIKMMPEGANREYLFAALNKASSDYTKDDVVRIMDYIKTAEAMDPTNPVYKMIHEEISREFEKYQTAYKLWEEEQKEIADRKRRADTTTSILKGTVSVIFTILGGIGTVLLGIFGCFCECMDGC